MFDTNFCKVIYRQYAKASGKGADISKCAEIESTSIESQLQNIEFGRLYHLLLFIFSSSIDSQPFKLENGSIFSHTAGFKI